MKHLSLYSLDKVFSSRTMMMSKAPSKLYFLSHLAFLTSFISVRERSCFGVNFRLLVSPTFLQPPVLRARILLQIIARFSSFLKLGSMEPSHLHTEMIFRNHHTVSLLSLTCFLQPSVLRTETILQSHVPLISLITFTVRHHYCGSKSNDHWHIGVWDVNLVCCLLLPRSSLTTLISSF